MSVRPNLDVFNMCFKVSSDISDTYDILPDLDVKYPFIHVNRTETTPDDFKIEESGLISQVIDVWGTRTQRQVIDDIVKSLHNSLRKSRKTNNFYFRVQTFNENLIMDNSTHTPLLHCHVRVNFLYTKRRLI